MISTTTKISTGAIIFTLFFLVIYQVEKTKDVISYEYDSEKKMTILASPNRDNIMSYLSENNLKEKVVGNFHTLTNNNENICINGKNPSNLTEKEKLQEFIKGPCAPLVVIPGILGTSLRLQITDCYALRDSHPNLFNDCSWYTCSQNWFVRLLGYSPYDEYTLWVAIDSTMGLLAFEDKHSRCFGGLIASYYNRSEADPRKKFLPANGTKVTWYGNTPQTKGSSDCGAAAIQYYSGIYDISCETKGFGPFTEFFKKLGYQSGLTYQALPYDFRHSYDFNDLSFVFPRVIRNIYQITGKKVVLLAHSMGNLNTLPFLNEMSQEEKDKMIALYVAAQAPFDGAIKAVATEIGGSTDLLKFGVIGLSYNGQKGFLGNSSSMYDLFPKGVHQKFLNEEWMADIIKRIEEEEKNLNNDTFWLTGNYSLDWMPSPLEECLRNTMPWRNTTHCVSGMKHWWKNPSLKIEGKEYNATPSDMKKILKDYIITSEVGEEIYDLVMRRTEVSDWKNPNVPTLLYYGAFMPTAVSHEFKNDPKLMTVNNNLAAPDFSDYILGDGTVVASAASFPGFKWIHEHHNKNKNPLFANAKPIKLIEYCSHYRNTKPVYDTMETLGVGSFYNSEYLGRNCACLENGYDPQYCRHSCLPSDEYFAQFMLELVMNNHTSEKTAKASLMTDLEIEYMQKECPVLTTGPEIEDIFRDIFNKGALINQ